MSFQQADAIYGSVTTAAALNLIHFIMILVAFEACFTSMKEGPADKTCKMCFLCIEFLISNILSYQIVRNLALIIL